MKAAGITSHVLKNMHAKAGVQCNPLHQQKLEDINNDLIHTYLVLAQLNRTKTAKLAIDKQLLCKDSPHQQAKNSEHNSAQLNKCKQLRRLSM